MNKINEILVLHHSHLDLGYTHTQPVMKSLQIEYITQALDLLDETSHIEKQSQPKWTCEVTMPVTWWLDQASNEDIERFGKYLKNGRIGISGLAYNGTPLSNVATLSAQFEAKKMLEERFNININTVNIHDVNGMPWGFVDLMIDEGIELLTMAVNIHLGHQVTPRPGIFKWEGPSGRSILVMNGEHYTMFDQNFYTWEKSVHRMKEGWEEYKQYLKTKDYPFDFTYLTTTNPVELWDNAPPNPMVTKLIQEWNKDKSLTPIRYVTPKDLLAKLKTVDVELIPVKRGDWTDYWIFGAGSTAYEVKIAREARKFLIASESLNALRNQTNNKLRIKHRADTYYNLITFEEHTWANFETDLKNTCTRPQELFKKYLAHQARELAFFQMTEELELLGENEKQSPTIESLVLFNPSSSKQAAYPKIPKDWHSEGKFLRATRFQEYHSAQRRDGEQYGPIEIDAYGVKQVLLKNLKPVELANDLKLSIVQKEKERKTLNTDFLPELEIDRIGTIENEFYKITYNLRNGFISSVYDKKQDWEVLSQGKNSFFEFIRERTDGMIDYERTAFHKRDLDREKRSLHNWMEWDPIYERAHHVNVCHVIEFGNEITLVTKMAAPSVKDLTRKITLKANSPRIAIEVSFEKLSYDKPEGIYFTIPLNLEGNWKAHFDTTGISTELDKDQLEMSCRNLLCVDNYLSIHKENKGATLFCPDAPLVMAGNFHFGTPKAFIKRNKNPMLLAWPMNNYWDTNFPLIQPGYVSLNYEFMTHGKYDSSMLAKEANKMRNPVISGPSTQAVQHEKTLMSLSSDKVEVFDIKKTVDNDSSFIIRLMSLDKSDLELTINFANHIVSSNFCSPSGINQESVSCSEKSISILLKPQHISHLKIEFSKI